MLRLQSSDLGPRRVVLLQLIVQMERRFDDYEGIGPTTNFAQHPRRPADTCFRLQAVMVERRKFNVNQVDLQRLLVELANTNPPESFESLVIRLAT